MDRNWNRGRQPNSASQHHNYYRKKNDFSGQDYYNKTVKSVVQQPIKKEGLQVASIENELMDINFSWLKNTIIAS